MKTRYQNIVLNINKREYFEPSLWTPTWRFEAFPVISWKLEISHDSPLYVVAHRTAFWAIFRI